MIEIHQGRGLRRLEEKSNQTFYNWIERMIVVLFDDKSTQVVQGGFQSGWCIFLWDNKMGKRETQSRVSPFIF